MSRKFLDDNIELKLTGPMSGASSTTTLPKQAFATYDRGHLVVDTGSGLRFVNEGNSTSSLFVNERYNALVLHDMLTQLPLIGTHQSGSTNTACFVVGTNAVDSTATFDTTGGVKLTTTTASGDQVILAFNNTNSVWGTASLIADNSLVFEAEIVTGAAITSEIIWAGLKLTNTSVVATDDDQAFFRFAVATDAFWHFVNSVANTDVDTASTVTVAASTAYLLQIRVGNDRKPHYFINGVRVGIGAALTAATALKPYVGVQTATTAAKNITVRHCRIILPRLPLAV